MCPQLGFTYMLLKASKVPSKTGCLFLIIVWLAWAECAVVSRRLVLEKILPLATENKLPATGVALV